MKKILAVVFILFSNSINADIPPDQKLEIEYLLNFVKNSSCEINRNGKNHEGNKAVSHIKKKYDYFKDDIKTTEQFVELSATKSTMSGKYYMVKCGDSKPFRTKEWLLKELKNYRKNGNS